MNRDLFLLTLMQQNTVQKEQVSEWAKLECLFNCSQSGDEFIQNQKGYVNSHHFREVMAQVLRKVANKLDPVKLAR